MATRLTASLKCHQGRVIAGTKGEVEGNYCLYYEQFIDNSVNEPSIITDVLTWKVIKDSKTQRSLVECLRDNMKSITRTEDLSDAHAVAIVIVYITIASLACICIVAVYRSPDRHAREIESPERPPSK
nr:unnamed protein product [Haemonchus contortus]